MLPQLTFETVQRQIRQHRGTDAALGCAFLGGIEDVLIHEPSFQPLVKDGFRHWDVSQQPIVADPVKAGLDVAL